MGGGLFGRTELPDVPIDTDVISEEDLSVYASALERNGFFGPSSWYSNHETNAAYGRKAANDGYIDMPALFVAARYDYVCESVHSRLGEPMRKYCRNLSEEVIRAGHWVAQEKPRDCGKLWLISARDRKCTIPLLASLLGSKSWRNIPELQK